MRARSGGSTAPVGRTPDATEPAAEPDGAGPSPDAADDGPCTSTPRTTGDHPGRPAGDHPGRPAGDHPGRPAGGDRRNRLARWPAPLRIPLEVAGRTLAKAWQDRILGLSAEAAFWQILSVPPLLIGLLGSLGYLAGLIGDAAVVQIEQQLLEASERALTSDVVESLVAPTLTDILGSGRLELISVGFLVSLWAGSSATATFMNTVVIAYDQRDVRGPIRTRLMALWLFVVGLVLAVLTLPLLVLGREVLVALVPADWQYITGVLVDGVYWPLVVVGLVVALNSFYSVVLPRRLPWRRHLPGSLLAVAFFVLAARLLRSYVTDVLVAALPYGALATPIAALLFCFFFGMAVLLGAELNATVQARWPAPLRRHGRRRRRRRAAKLDEARRLDAG